MALLEAERPQDATRKHVSRGRSCEFLVPIVSSRESGEIDPDGWAT